MISLGGGAVLRAANREAIAAAGVVVWLTATAETIHARISADGSTASQRPNLTGRGGLAEVEELLATRAPLYEACCDLEISTEDRTIAELAGEIIAQTGIGASG